VRFVTPVTDIDAYLASASARVGILVVAPTPSALFVNVSAPVCSTSPAVASSPARAVRVASEACFVASPVSVYTFTAF
jgi:hypothetical protein